MNSWRDIKTDPPELRKPIVATDGKDVFFGKLTYGGFEGIDVQDGNFIAIIGEMANLPLTGWMPPPRTWELGEKGEAHWEHIIEQKPEFDAAGRFLGISETPKVRCSHCKQTNKNYESPFCPHCGAPMTEEVAEDG